jgi:hypothetical protein
MKTFHVIETTGILMRDRCSHGHQFSVDRLRVDDYCEKEVLISSENKIVKVTIQIEVEDEE